MGPELEEWEENVGGHLKRKKAYNPRPTFPRRASLPPPGYYLYSRFVEKQGEESLLDVKSPLLSIAPFLPPSDMKMLLPDAPLHICRCAFTGRQMVK